MRIYEGKVCPPAEGKIAIIVSRFNKSITEHMLNGALEKLRQHSINDENITVVWVPGAFELPTLAQRFAEDENYQAVICLGCVIKGETTHDQHINRAVSLELARIGAEFCVPVIFGVLTCNTKDQALARSGLNEQSRDKIVDPTVGNKGAEAAESALEMIDLLLQLPELPGADSYLQNITANTERYRSELQNETFNRSYLTDNDDDDDYVDDDQDYEEANDDAWFQPGQSHRKQHNQSSHKESRHSSSRNASDSKKHHSKNGHGRQHKSSGHSSSNSKSDHKNYGKSKSSSMKKYKK
ncbi:MAG: 6,7-dimethyl-8-ribityllumazine synthase [Planctomycetia bacterium]|nr:6,7-dimethyl-8-ribityllumazine synthase [Planctomycetia bacterium]